MQLLPELLKNAHAVDIARNIERQAEAERPKPPQPQKPTLLTNLPLNVRKADPEWQAAVEYAYHCGVVGLVHLAYRVIQLERLNDALLQAVAELEERLSKLE